MDPDVRRGSIIPPREEHYAEDTVIVYHLFERYMWHTETHSGQVVSWSHLFLQLSSKSISGTRQTWHLRDGVLVTAGTDLWYIYCNERTLLQ